MGLRIVLAEDSLLVRTGVEGLLEGEGDLEVVASVASLPELLAAVRELTPDLVITDVRMPPTQTDEGIVAACAMRTSHPATGVLVLSQAADPGFLRRLLEGGSERRGYILKDNLATPGELLTAIDLIRAGGSFIDPAMVELLVAHQTRKQESPLSVLTERETETLTLVAGGYSNSAIGEKMFISHRSVEKNINSIFSKLGLPEDSTNNRRVLAVLLFLERP